ncbi:sulfur carrier protein ThiS adenylyltransferase ThiF [Fusobacterium sp. MFO224]|uniref:sulfur carrier protein ThiS adenylyltransferase ThiF n=1 Tax=Fusobacterium sp. MFO224 TaxID=3378070 RepID=UPI003854856C
MIIGIAGCGGIGSNVACHLVRTGITYLKFGDFDKIEPSNLNRQFFFENQVGLFKSETLAKNLNLINSKAKFDYKIIKFDKNNIANFFKECDIVIEAFDKKENKVMLIEELLPLNKIIISASGIGNFKTDTIKRKKMGKNLFIVGDFETDIDKNKTYSHKVNAVASIMAELVLEKGGYYEK